MRFRRPASVFGLILLTVLGPHLRSAAQTSPPSPSASEPSTPKPARKAPAATAEAQFDAGAVSAGVYRNKTLGLTCKIPEGWVLRTDEMNKREDEHSDTASGSAAAASSAGARVLLGAFSRPPEARGEQVNASIMIAAESASSYPGLTEAAQYFGPLTEVAKAQGFEMDEDPYAIAIGAKTLVRSDFHKNVGTRVMRQSTLVFLDHGYALSITVIGGTDDEVEDLVDGLSFASTGAKK